MKLNKFLFPEYKRDTLDIKKDNTIIIWRILEYGNLREIKWLFKTYSKQEIKNFVKVHGIKKLSIKSLWFWLCFFNIKNKNKIIKEKLRNPFWYK